MLADGRDVAHDGFEVGELERWQQGADGTVFGHDVPPFVACGELLVIPCRQRIVQPAVGDAVPVQQRGDLGGGHGGEEVFDQRGQVVAVLAPGVLVAKRGSVATSGCRRTLAQKVTHSRSF